MIILSRVIACQCLVITAFASQAACAEKKETTPSLPQSAQSANSSGFTEQPFPASLIKYKSKIFELANKDEAKYDKEFSHQLNILLASQLQRDPKLLKKIMSGPTANGTYIATQNTSFVYYGICQAHQCDLTNLDILFETKNKKMVGQFLNKCKFSWLGNPNEVEKNILKNLHLISFTAPSVNDCEDSK